MLFICIAFASLKYLWDMQKQSLMHSSTSHVAPHICWFPNVSRKVRLWTMNQSSVVRPLRRRLGDLPWILQATKTHLICRNFICQASAIAETRVKQRAFSFKSCWFVRHQQGYPSFFALITAIFSAVGASQTGYLVSFISSTSFVHKIGC